MDAPVDLLEEAVKASDDLDRADLRARLDIARRRFLDPSVRVLIVGEFKQGKSQLVNALINASLCPVDDDIATSVPTVVMHGDTIEACLVYALEQRDDNGERQTERFQVPIDSIANAVSEKGNPGNEQRLLHAEVTMPREILTGGLVLVDTPGIGGVGSAHSAATIAALPAADAVILVSDAAQEYSKPELDFLQSAAKLCPNVACVMTKTDLYPAWRQVVELNRQHLRTAKFDAPLLPVSSVLRTQALRRSDREMNLESGFPELIGFLRRNVVGNAATLARKSVAHDVVSVTGHLIMALEAELSVLQDPMDSSNLVSQLEEARIQADNLRRRSSRWSQTLGDGVSDLGSDIDHDIRDQMRRLAREAEDYLEDIDPALRWDEFSEWLTDRILSVVATNFVWAYERSEWLATQVAEHFNEEALESLPRLRSVDTETVFAPVPDIQMVRDDHVNFGQKVLTGMKGSYSGTLMTGLVTSVVTGMALVNPISLSVGVVLGGKAYRDDKKNRLKRRQAEGKNVVRRHLDDVVFQISKSSRDELRVSQRVLRDHFTDRADEMHRSLLESVKLAQQADKRTGLDRERRIREIKPQLQRLQQLQQRALALGKPIAQPA